MNNYITKAMRTLAPGQGTMLHVVLGLNGEWHEINQSHCDEEKEIGDFFWYLALGFHVLGIKHQWQETIDSYINDTDLCIEPDALMVALDELTDLVKRALIYNQDIQMEQYRSPMQKALLAFVDWVECYSSDYTVSDIDDILSANISKLEKRYPDKFTTEASIAKEDMK